MKIDPTLRRAFFTDLKEENDRKPRDIEDSYSKFAKIRALKMILYSPVTEKAMLTLSQEEQKEVIKQCLEVWAASNINSNFSRTAPNISGKAYLELYRKYFPEENASWMDLRKKYENSLSEMKEEYDYFKNN